MIHTEFDPGATVCGVQLNPNPPYSGVLEGVGTSVGCITFADPVDGTNVQKIECFYLFAKIFLDRLSRLIECYFGAARRCSLDSHDSLTKSIDRYLDDRGLPPLTDHMRFLMTNMKANVSDYRDYEIAHEKSNRSRGLLIPPREFGPPVITAVDRWRDGDKPRESGQPDRVHVSINDYLGEWLRFLAAHRDRCRVQPGPDGKAMLVDPDRRDHRGPT